MVIKNKLKTKLIKLNDTAGNNFTMAIRLPEKDYGSKPDKRKRK